MKIGDLAAWAKCPAVTIRYYEKIGLLTGNKRDHLNHRIYDDEDMACLRFIMHCRNHDISIPDIRSLLKLRNGTGMAGVDAIYIIRNQIERLKSQRESLDILIDSLSRLLDISDSEKSDGKKIIEILGNPCPHCTDYPEWIKDGTKIDERAACLADPSIRKSHKIF